MLTDKPISTTPFRSVSGVCSTRDVPSRPCVRNIHGHFLGMLMLISSYLLFVSCFIVWILIKHFSPQFYSQLAQFFFGLGTVRSQIRSQTAQFMRLCEGANGEENKSD